MKCPHCNNPNNTVLESQTWYAGTRIRRQRECHGCYYRWTTYELSQEELDDILQSSDNDKYNKLQTACRTILEALTDSPNPVSHPADPSLMELHFAQHQQEQREGEQSA